MVDGKVGKKPKVLFTFVEAGMGHIIPMNAIYSAFKNKYGDKCDVVKSYVFSESESLAVRKMGEEQVLHVKRAAKSRLYAFSETVGYKLSSRFTHFILDNHFGKGIKDGMKELSAASPDLVVSTYYLPSHIAAKTNEKGMTDTLIATYTPDFYVYPAWDRRCDLFITNNGNAFDMAVKKGFCPDAVKKIPFIYGDNVLNAPADKSSARENLGLEDRFTLLFAGGAYGTKRAEKIIEEIEKKDYPVNFVIACGKNQKLYDKTAEFAKTRKGKMSVTALGFTDRLAEYMRAADLVIAKGGTNTVMEAIYLDCPLIIIAEANRLEEITAGYCHKEGLAVREHKPKKILKIIEKSLTDENYLKGFTERYKEFKNPEGANECADLLYGLLKKKFPEIEN